MEEKVYIAIDLKSFYASVECTLRGLDPLTTNLVVADNSRTSKTICLAVSPSLKSYGISGRARLFEVIKAVKDINYQRQLKAPNHTFTAKSYNNPQLLKDPSLELDYLIATPQMRKYMEYSNRIFNIYLKYVAPEDMHVYSIDEVFIDATSYLKTYNVTPNQFAMMMIKDVLSSTGITATAGIGTNLYLAKVAMDIVAKHIEPDENGVRIAQLDELSYRKKLWNHRPLTDFWRIGKGISKRLEINGMYTMGDVARCSIGSEKQFYNENLLYKLFGVNAELLIDHAWGYEPTEIKDIKNCKPASKSLGISQVLQRPYTYKEALTIVNEMSEALAMDMLDKNFVSSQLVLVIIYDAENLTNTEIARKYNGDITIDGYGRPVPKHGIGRSNLLKKTNSMKIYRIEFAKLFERIANKDLLIRKIGVSGNDVELEKNQKESESYQQLDLFGNSDSDANDYQNDKSTLEKERKAQKAMLDIQKKFGKNAVIKGMSLQKEATTKERNTQVGGHKG